MKSTYIDAAYSGSAAATPLDAIAGSDDDRVLYKILVGLPVGSATIVVYNQNNAYTGATTNIAFKHTVYTNAVTSPPYVIDLSAVAQGSPNGLVLSGGGSVTTSSAMEVTFLWDNPEV